MSDQSPQRWFNLEEQFFKGLDQELLNKLQQQTQLQQSAESIKQVTGIEDAGVAEAIARLNVSVETLAAFRLTPLVAVAWADDRIDSQERAVIAQAAEKSGLRAGDAALELLMSWTDKRPGPELLDAWCEYTKSLCSSLNEEERHALKREIMRQVKDVAEATGGLLGFGSVSPNEQATVKRVEAALS